ncbi:MAG: hypothetical protein OEZ39_16215 [Gammaproteobacteria bacterium]|nr:hypothetical protein [Gammaproteobacteria bacterium]MDH5653404.1 hypothetical protein [Gammaproteobacteria bacterium]
MKKLALSTILAILPLTTFAGGDYFKAQVIEFSDKGKNQFKLKLNQLSQPFGKKHKGNREIIIHLQYMCPLKKCDGEYNKPTLQTYNSGIKLLRNQIEASKYIKFGVMGRGYKLIDGTKNQYESRGLKIHNDVVYSYYDY